MRVPHVLTRMRKVCAELSRCTSSTDYDHRIHYSTRISRITGNPTAVLYSYKRRGCSIRSNESASLARKDSNARW